MKTAVSIPDPIFEAAEAMSKRLGLSRSELYARALQAYFKGNLISEWSFRCYAKKNIWRLVQILSQTLSWRERWQLPLKRNVPVIPARAWWVPIQPCKKTANTTVATLALTVIPTELAVGILVVNATLNRAHPQRLPIYGQIETTPGTEESLCLEWFFSLLWTLSQGHFF